VGSWGPLILGHAPPGVPEAIATAAKGGTSFGASTAAEADLADILHDWIHDDPGLAGHNNIDKEADCKGHGKNQSSCRPTATSGDCNPR